MGVRGLGRGREVGGFTFARTAAGEAAISMLLCSIVVREGVEYGDG